jgi:predicted RNA binding protein YcfA (HicA-like mRNA interferase family)
MPAFGPIDRRKLIAALRTAGFSGPYSGTDHQFMVRDELAVRIPNPHGSDIGRNLLSEILKQAGISRKEWERL